MKCSRIFSVQYSGMKTVADLQDWLHNLDSAVSLAVGLVAGTVAVVGARNEERPPEEPLLAPAGGLFLWYYLVQFIDQLQ